MEQHNIEAVTAFVVNQEIDVNQYDHNYAGQTPLHHAADQGYIDITTILLAHPTIDVNQ